MYTPSDGRSAHGFSKNRESKQCRILALLLFGLRSHQVNDTLKQWCDTLANISWSSNGNYMKVWLWSNIFPIKWRGGTYVGISVRFSTVSGQKCWTVLYYIIRLFNPSVERCRRETSECSFSHVERSQCGLINTLTATNYSFPLFGQRNFIVKRRCSRILRRVFVSVLTPTFLRPSDHSLT